MRYATQIVPGLSAEGLGIASLNGIQCLTSLTDLNLYSNQVSNLAPLAGLSSLTELWLYSNQVSDLAPLAGLSSLTFLNLDSNQVSDLSSLVSDEWLDSGDYVDVSNNLIDQSVQQANIDALCDRGVDLDPYC